MELGVDVVEEYRKKGFATEIIKALIEKAHDICVGASVIARLDKTNEASRGLVEKCGGIYAGCDDSQFAKALKKGKTGADYSDNEREVIESGTDSVLIYRLP